VGAGRVSAGVHRQKNFLPPDTGLLSLHNISGILSGILGWSFVTSGLHNRLRASAVSCYISRIFTIMRQIIYDLQKQADNRVFLL
jgi:heme A synthase